MGFEGIFYQTFLPKLHGKLYYSTPSLHPKPLCDLKAAGKPIVGGAADLLAFG